jgi:hypothetical protein
MVLEHGTIQSHGRLSLVFAVCNVLHLILGISAGLRFVSTELHVATGRWRL